MRRQNMTREDIAQQIGPPPYVKATFRWLGEKDADLHGEMIILTNNGYMTMNKKKVHNGDDYEALTDEALLIWFEKVLNDGLPALGQNPLATSEDAGAWNHWTQSRENNSIATFVGPTSQPETTSEVVHETCTRPSLLTMPHKPNHISDRVPAGLKDRWVVAEKTFIFEYQDRLIEHINHFGMKKVFSISEDPEEVKASFVLRGPLSRVLAMQR